MGPSAGKEWFWLLSNRKLDPSHLVPSFARGSAAAAAASGSGGSYYGTWASAAAAPGPNSGSGSGSSRRWPWRAGRGMWWAEGWALGAVCLHSWPAHKERMRTLAADPWERFLATAGARGCTC
jgi:hypothetical protein